MKVLIAVVTCHADKFRARAQSQRETWMKDVNIPGVDIRFFLGRGVALQPDEVILDTDDDYRSLPAKTQALSQWALEQGYEFVFKCDDDVYVQVDRLLKSDFAQLGDYVGRKRGPSGGFRAPYASGFSYWLSRRAMRVIAAAPLNGDSAEDRWVGNTLLKCGIACTPDYRYAVVESKKNAISFSEGPRHGNLIISACEFTPERMRDIHRDWNAKQAVKIVKPEFGAHPLSRVCVLVKTFLRDGYLMRTVRSLQESLPESKIVIVDDGFESALKISWYAKLREQGHVAAWLPFDSGFGAKANEGVLHCDREYVLIASDDFLFTQETRNHVTSMVRLLRSRPELHVASGRVNNNPYESKLVEEGDRVTETKGYYGEGSSDGVRFLTCDLTVNFSLINRRLLDIVHWDGDVKIGGGEHGAFFLDIKRAGGKVCYVPGANVKEMPRGCTDWQHAEYNKMRNRAREAGRACLVRRGVRQWVLQDGTVEETGL